MAEAVGAASAVITLLEVTADILRAGYSYIQKVKRAPSEIRVLLNEVSAIDTLLDQIQQLSTDDSSTDRCLTSLAEKGYLQGCEDALQRTNQAINKCVRAEGQLVKNAAKRVIWPFKEGHVQELLTELERSRRHLSDAVALDSVGTIRQIHATTQAMHAGLKETHDKNQEQALLSWICPNVGSSSSRYATAISAHEPGTGQWLLESAQLRAALEEGQNIWITGPAGTGKTILAATLVDHLQKDTTRNTIVACFFFDLNVSSESSTQQFLMTITAQVLRQKPASLSHVKEAYETDPSRGLTISERSRILKRMLADFSRLVIVIDALDEASYPIEIIQILKSIESSSLRNRHTICITSRNSLRIEKNLEGFVSATFQILEAGRKDVDRYIDKSLATLARQGQLRLRDPRLADEIRRRVLDKCGGIFLQAKFHLDYIKGMKSDKTIKKALEELPSGLNDTYERILYGIMRDHSALLTEVKRMLIWLTHAMMPLTPDILAEATAIEEDDSSLDIDAIATDPEDLVSVLGSLVFIDRKQEVPIVSLSHLSVSEFLHSDFIRKSPVSCFAISTGAAHRYLAQVCVQYMGFSNFVRPLRIVPHYSPYGQHVLPRKKMYYHTRNLEVVQLRGTHKLLRYDRCVMDRLIQFALLGYAATCWTKHLKEISTANDDACIKSKLGWFLDSAVRPTGQFDSWLEIHHCYCNFPDDCELHQSPLFFAISMGLEMCFDDLSSAKLDPNIVFPGGWTPLTLAVNGGSTYILRKLLDAGANVDQQADMDAHNGFTALHLAAEQGNLEMVELLLSYNASVHVRTKTETTPFYRATRSGSLPVIALLHRAGSDVNATTWDNYTPLIEPTYKGDLDVVKMLLVFGADPLITTATGICPVAFARDYEDLAMLYMFRTSLAARGQQAACEAALQRHRPSRLAFRKNPRPKTPRKISTEGS